MTNRFQLILVLILGVLFTADTAAQDFLISQGGTINTCSGTLYDSGGALNTYQDGEMSVMTICSDDPDLCIGLDFVSYSIEQGFDLLTFFAGDSQFAPVIGTLEGTGNNFSVTSTTGCITVLFTSDGIIALDGFEADITCSACPTCDDGILNGLENGVDCGGDCEACPCADVMVPSIPYSLTTSTCGNGSSFDWQDACTNFNITGEDMTFSVVAEQDGCMSVELSNLPLGSIGLIVTEGCPDDPSAACMLSLSQFNVNTMNGIFIAEAGETYFITVGSDEFGTPCMNFTIEIDDQCPSLTPADCFGAIPVCQDEYSEFDSPSGNGSFPGEFAPGSCNASETNAYWYSFTVQETGMLSFIIEPNDQDDDYDWSLFNITEFGCEDISSTPAMEVSCNSWGELGVNGPTGISTAEGGVGNSNGPGDLNGPPFNADLPVNQGETYALVVMNWSNSQVGYNLDFGGSSADIFDDTSPEIESVQVACSNMELRLTFSEPVLCSSLISENFELTGPNGVIPVNEVASQNCSFGAQLSTVALLNFNIALEPGLYTIDGNALGAVVDPCGNEVNTVFNFEVFAGFSVNPVISDACGPGQGAVDASDYTGGIAPITFTLDGVTNATGLFDGLDAGTYTLLLEDSNSCELETEVTINEELLELEVSGEFDVCELSTEVTAVFDLGNIEWTGSLGLEISDPSADVITVSSDATGTYTLTATLSTNSCETSIDQEINLVQPLELTAEVTHGCAPGEGEIEVTALLGGEGIITYNLDGDENATGLFDGLNTGVYLLSATDENGCWTEEEFEVSVVELSIDLGDDVEVCFLSTTLSAEIEGENILWTGPSGIAFGDDSALETSVVSAASGSYIITAEVFSEFCTVVDQIEVSFSEPIQFDFEVEDASCFGFCDAVATFTTIPDDIPLSLSGEAEFTDQREFYNLCADQYTVILIDELGCLFETEVLINQPPQIIAAFDASPQPTQIPNSLIEFNNLSEGYDFLHWDFGWEEQDSFEENPSFEFPSDVGGIYFVTLAVESAIGCTDSITKRIVIEDILNAFVPNAFTPNGDGLNDIFLPQFSATPFIYELMIFDRWGGLVFESKDPNKPWLGNVNGGEHYVENGVYVWIMKVGRTDIDSQEIKGHVTVFR